MARLLSTIIEGFIKSRDFVSGALGTGWRIAKQFGRWVLEIDDIVVRGRMTVFELLIQKIRAVKGALSITQGSGKIKEIREDDTNYYLQIEDEMSFVANDIIKCQTFSSGQKNYWVIVSRVENNEVVIPKSEFLGSSLPEVGDEMIQFGNTTDETRQSAIYLHADEGGQPAIDVLFGINSKSFEGKTKIKIGGDIPGELSKKGFYCENGLIKSVNTSREVMYMLRPDGSGVMAKGNISWDAAGNGSIFNKSIYWDVNGFHFGSGIKLTWDNLPADAKETLKGDKGDAGESAVRLDLTNENASVTCDATGNVVGIIPPSVARIFKGGVVDSGWAFSGVVDGCRATVGSVTGLVSVIELLADNASVTVQANKNGYTRLEAVYNLSKVYPGADGEPAVIYSVRPSVDVMVKGKDGVVTPASISCEKLKQIGNSAPYVTNEKTLKYQLSNGSLASYTGAVNIGNASWIEFTLYDGSTVLDRERVPVIADGQDGDPGNDANLLPWVDEWNSPNNQTEIGGEYVISPKMFSGTKDQTTGKLTGVAFGRGVVTVDGAQKTGVFGIKDGNITFSIDAETGDAFYGGSININNKFKVNQLGILECIEAKISGEINATSGVFAGSIQTTLKKIAESDAVENPNKWGEYALVNDLQILTGNVDVILPNDLIYIGKRCIIVNPYLGASRVPVSTYVRVKGESRIMGVRLTEDQKLNGKYCRYIQFNGGQIELLGVPWSDDEHPIFGNICHWVILGISETYVYYEIA